MDDDQDKELKREPADEDGDIKKSQVLRKELNQFVKDNDSHYSLTPQSSGPSGKLITLILFILAIIVIGAGIYFVAGVGSPKSKEQQIPSPVASPQATPTPKPLNRSEWSFEILNGSGVTGAAAKLATSLRELGYQVVKTGNADRDDYKSHLFFVQEDLQEKIEAVVVDIKDVIKISSISGQLKDSTASARIIIGKQ